MYMSQVTPKAAKLSFKQVVLTQQRKAAKERAQKEFVSSAFKNAAGRAQGKRNLFVAASAQGKKQVHFSSKSPIGTLPMPRAKFRAIKAELERREVMGRLGKKSPVYSTNQKFSRENINAFHVENKKRKAQSAASKKHQPELAATNRQSQDPVMGTPAGNHRRQINTSHEEQQNYENYEEQNHEGPCWSEKIVPMIAFYTLICSLLFVTGVLDPQKGLGLKLFILNLVLLCMFAGVVMMRPDWTYIGGCV